MQTMTRLNKELSELNSDSNFTVKVNESNNKIWNVSFKGVENTLYAGETFTLQFKFSDQYVKYINNIIAKRQSRSNIYCNIPVHEHIYSNGYICLAILYNDWKPTMNVSYVCLGILTMLSSDNEKKKPYNDADFCSWFHGSPKQANWIFDHEIMK